MKMKMKKPIVSLREVTKKTLPEILKLQVTEYQNRFVASNAISIAEAYFTKKAWFRGIYADDTPVGFLMMYIDTRKPVYYLWRFMIDQRYQRMGYGQKAMELLLEIIRSMPKAATLTLSYAPGEGNPSPFYRQFGFEETGEMDEGERVMKLIL
jgi:diamine N-acetyltransferase